VEHWNSVSNGTGIAIDSDAVCQLLNAIGSTDHTTLAQAVLELVNRQVPMADCSMMAFVAERNPRVVSVCSHSDDHQIFHCASNYARHLYQHDRIQLHLQSILPQQEVGHVTVHRQTLTQIIDAELRRLYNDTLDIIDSVAVTIKTGRREWITTSLCRHRDQGPLDQKEIETLLQLASLIATSVSRHCRIEADGEGDYQTSVSDGIDQLCSLLTKRERQVILRILDGVTVQQIAEELGLKPTTIITYRSRAYEKLGISSRRELFSAVLHNRKGSNRWQPADISANPPRFNGPAYAASTGTDRPHQ
jgi:DNA-binding CsgD family transcriptional regulator